MRIQELVGTSLASRIPRDIEKMLLKPTRIKFDSGHQSHEIRSDVFLSNLISYRSKASEIASGDRNVHPTSMLGFFTSQEAMDAIFKDNVVIRKIKTFDVTKPKGPENPHGKKDDNIGGYYDRPGKTFPYIGKAPDPAGGHIYLNKVLFDRGLTLAQNVIYSHEVMHRGLAMANWNNEIKKYINPIMLRRPFNAWGSNDDKEEQLINSEKRFGNQFGCLEHIMMYAWEGGQDQVYRMNPMLFRTVPGFEDFAYWQGEEDEDKAQILLDKGKKPQSVKAVASGLLNLIGKGCTQYILKMVQKINSIPDEDLDMLIIKFAEIRGIR